MKQQRFNYEEMKNEEEGESSNAGRFDLEKRPQFIPERKPARGGESDGGGGSDNGGGGRENTDLAYGFTTRQIG